MGALVHAVLPNPACHASVVPTLVTITGPIAAGKNAAAEDLARRCIASGQTVIQADVDAVAAIVVGSGAAAAGLWFAAHEAHGASSRSGCTPMLM